MFLTVGYVKTTSVEIDFNTLKNHKASPASSYDPEVYDDIDVASPDNRYQDCRIIYSNSTSVIYTDQLYFCRDGDKVGATGTRTANKKPQHYATHTLRH